MHLFFFFFCFVLFCFVFLFFSTRSFPTSAFCHHMQRVSGRLWRNLNFFSSIPSPSPFLPPPPLSLTMTSYSSSIPSLPRVKVRRRDDKTYEDTINHLCSMQSNAFASLLPSLHFLPSPFPLPSLSFYSPFTPFPNPSPRSILAQWKKEVKEKRDSPICPPFPPPTSSSSKLKGFMDALAYIGVDTSSQSPLSIVHVTGTKGFSSLFFSLLFSLLFILN